MPKRVNEEKRRERIAEAVWDIAADQGLERATIRAVAAKCGLSVGSIQHSFRTQGDLKRFAMELVAQRVTMRLNDAERSSSCPDDKAAAIAELLMETLPLDAEREKEARIWAAFLTAALTDEELSSYGLQISGALGQFCLGCIRELKGSQTPRSDSDIRLEAAHLRSLLDGLTLALLIDPSRARRQEAEDIVRSFVERYTERP